MHSSIDWFSEKTFCDSNALWESNACVCNEVLNFTAGLIACEIYSNALWESMHVCTMKSWISQQDWLHVRFIHRLGNIQIDCYKSPHNSISMSTNCYHVDIMYVSENKSNVELSPDTFLPPSLSHPHPCPHTVGN